LAFASSQEKDKKIKELDTVCYIFILMNKGINRTCDESIFITQGVVA
jgi:hypothetical protein